MKYLFEQILKKYREKSGVTQEIMVDLLSHNSSKLKKLDNVTFSRWERGITIPPFKKQIEIYQLLGVDPIDEIIDLNIELPKVDNDNYFASDFYTYGNSDFVTHVLNRNTLSGLDSVLEEMELIIDSDYYFKQLIKFTGKNSIKKSIESLMAKLNAEIIICKYKSRLIAHSITLYVSPDFLKDLMCNEIDYTKIKDYASNNPLIISFYASTNDSLKYILGRILTNFLNIPNIDSKLYFISGEKNMHKLFVKLNSKIKFNEIIGSKNYKLSEVTKLNIHHSKDALHFLVDFRRMEYEK
ncbi:helix-turn-helix transcriptional regulator [Aliivibrio fischeri]|uniref:helix-turn-helix transcriptional regulator n=1 Tax=Aliivibrio fischeri TaxID=668 RepID=UPI0012DA10F5|nr:helix-turn-helix transcriptional regulator [Aliivibrio fischeri]MUJ37164.1 transcriptional regulator [Aliivibrio fischeri]